MLPLLQAGSAPDGRAIEAIVSRIAAGDAEIETRVRAIIDDVRKRGDSAVRGWTEKIDRRQIGSLEASLPRSTAVDVGVAAALEAAAERIRAFHEHEKYVSWEQEQDGVRVGLRFAPLQRVGVYVPGGKARYPSTVLMAAIPAKVAGVAEVFVVSPSATAEVLMAAKLAGVSHVFQIGGAQAVAALAYGTESIPRVDKIVGPGSVWVTCAKRLVAPDVGIDFLAGPSEVLIVADDAANPAWIAADLLAQAEHDEAARPIVVTPSARLAREVGSEVAIQVRSLERREIAEAALRGGACITVADLEAAVALTNRIAPEHLGLHLRQPRQWADRFTTAGAIFLGAHTPEATGDYYAGPSHVLPTGGCARFCSPLGVLDFLKRTTTIEYSPAALAAHGQHIVSLAGVEGLQAHGRAVQARQRASAGESTR